MDTYTNDDIQLCGLKYKAPNPNEWKVVGDFYTYEPMSPERAPSKRAALREGARVTME